MKALLLLLLSAGPATAADIVVTAPGPSPFRAPRLRDAELAALRGGLQLPNGLNVQVGIDIQTWVNGGLALHSIYNSDGPNAGVRVYTDGTDAPRTAPGTMGVSVPGNAGLPSVTVDRSAGGTRISPTGANSPTTINLVTAPPAAWLTADNQTPVPVIANGLAVDAAPGKISLATGSGGAAVTLETPTLKVQQLIGQATGIVIANTANDRTIDTVSSINVDLRGVPTSLLPSAFMANRVALDAMTRR